MPEGTVDKKDVSEDDRSSSLIDRLLKEFRDYVVIETDPVVILLKGHLLIEHYFDELILLDADSGDGINLKRLSFYEKLEKLKPSLDRNLYRGLRALNSVRNDLAHQLNQKITISEIDQVGYTLGKKYILEKYNESMNDVKLLQLVIGNIASGVIARVAWKVLNPELPIPKKQ